jgi:hypothetical protein
MALSILVLCFASNLRALVVALVIILTIACSLMIQVLHIYRGEIAPRPIFCPSSRTIVLDDLLRMPFIIF